MSNKTPGLKPFNTEGGTLYVFPSVSRDLTKTFVGNDYEFKFSHFACLNIPNIYKGGYTSESQKGLYISTLMGEDAPSGTLTGEIIGKAIAENLQNYVMNFETAILNGEGDDNGYDPEILTTVSEKIFWNWLQKVGAIKFTDNGIMEDTSSISERTVQYIGNIDMINTVEIDDDVYEELYIHIPSSVGASTNIYFRAGDMTDNKNYIPNKSYSINDGEYIMGWTSEDTHPYNLCIKSFVDDDNGGNVYIADMGHTIDFRDSSYDGGDGISTMNGKSIDDFEFNAVLIYYDIYEKTKTPGVKKVATNLYGVLFLDQVKIENEEIYIQRYPKKKETVYGGGNSYALKLDLRVKTFSDNTIDVKVPSEDSLESMSLYINALEQLQKCIDIFYTQKKQIVNLTERVAYLENLIMGIDSISTIKEDIQRLWNRCDENSVVDTSTLLGLIDNNSKRISNLMTGGKDIQLQYDTDVLQAGIGIGLEKSKNKVIINSEQKYAINTVYSGNEGTTEVTKDRPINPETSKICRIPLKVGENFAVIYIDAVNECQDDFTINIVESEGSEWHIGQSLKIMFVYNSGSVPLSFASAETNGVIINPKSGTSLSIMGGEFEGNNLIEVICVGENTFEYLIK